MLVNIWRVVRFRKPGDREDSFEEYFLAQVEAYSRKGRHFIVFPGVVHTKYRRYRNGKWNFNKNIWYVVRLDK